jgi:hypothetical protein
VGSSPEWTLADRAVLMIRAEPGGGVRRDVLARKLGVSWPVLWRALGPAYGARLVDFCGDFVVLSAVRRRAVLQANLDAAARS